MYFSMDRSGGRSTNVSRGATPKNVLFIKKLKGQRSLAIKNAFYLGDY